MGAAPPVNAHHRGAGADTGPIGPEHGGSFEEALDWALAGMRSTLLAEHQRELQLRMQASTAVHSETGVAIRSMVRTRRNPEHCGPGAEEMGEAPQEGTLALAEETAQPAEHGPSSEEAAQAAQRPGGAAAISPKPRLWGSKSRDSLSSGARHHENRQLIRNMSNGSKGQGRDTQRQQSQSFRHVLSRHRTESSFHRQQTLDTVLHQQSSKSSNSGGLFRLGMGGRRASLSSTMANRVQAIAEAAARGLGTKEDLAVTKHRVWANMRQGFVGNTFMGIVIMLNTVTLGLSVELARGWRGWFVLDSIFAVIFILELVSKLYDQGKWYFIGKGWHWNMFELTLVILAVLEVVFGLMADNDANVRALTAFRVFRFTRIARILRMTRLQIFNDLIMLISGAMGGAKTLLWSLVLISLPLYCLALVLTDTLREYVDEPNGADAFRNLGESFFTAFRCIVASDCSTADGRPIFVLITRDYGWGYGVMYCITVLLMNFGLFNVIVAIFVDNITAAAKFNDALNKKKRLWDSEMFIEKTTHLVEFIWRHFVKGGLLPDKFIDISQLEITPAFLNELRSFQEFQDLLRELDIADEDQLDLFDTLDVDGGGTIDLEELVTGLAKLRGDARRSDIVSVGLVLRSVQITLHDFEEKLTREIHRISEAPRSPSRSSARRGSGNATPRGKLPLLDDAASWASEHASHNDPNADKASRASGRSTGSRSSRAKQLAVPLSLDSPGASENENPSTPEPNMEEGSPVNSVSCRRRNL